MLKKWLYIFTAICLLNTIFCFHVNGFVAGDDGNPGLEEGVSYDGSGSLLDLLLFQIQDDGSDTEGKAPFKTKFRHGHFFSRFFPHSIQAPTQDAYGALYAPGRAAIEYGNYQPRKASLPSYYNFLFRLNPF